MAARADVQRAFRAATCMANAPQARALAALLERGELLGTSYKDVRPPRSVALVAMGELLTPPDGAEMLSSGDAPTKTLGVLGEDGRAWRISAAGITWPQEDA